MDNSKRIDSISLLRILSVISIISCHIMQFYDNELAWWFNTGVQVFLLMSGFLYSKKEIKVKEFYVKNITKILFDYYTYLFIILLIYFIFKKEFLSIKGVVKVLLGMGGIQGLGHTWFISTIIVCYLLTPFLQKIKKQTKNIFVLLAYFCCFMFFIELILHYFPYFIGVWINCYIIGYLINILYFDKQYKELSKKISFFIIAMGILTNIFQIYLQYVLKYQNTGLIGIFYRYNKVLLALVVFIFFSDYLKGYKTRSKAINYIYSDKYSYNIYLTHHIYVLGPFSILNFSIFKGKIIGIFVVFLLSIVSGVFLNILCKKLKSFIEI